MNKNTAKNTNGNASSVSPQIPAASLQRLRARVARRPGRWRRRMRRGRVRLDPEVNEQLEADSPSVEWEAKCRSDRVETEQVLDAA